MKGHYTSPKEHIKYRLNWITHDDAVAILKDPKPGYELLSRPLQLLSHQVSVHQNNELIPSSLKSTINKTYYFPPMTDKLLKDNNWPQQPWVSLTGIASERPCLLLPGVSGLATANSQMAFGTQMIKTTTTMVHHTPVHNEPQKNVYHMLTHANPQKEPIPLWFFGRTLPQPHEEEASRPPKKVREG